MKKFASVVLAVFLLMLVVTPNALASSGQGDRVIVGEQYVLRSGERLEGDLTVIGGSATLEAGSIVTGDVLLLGGSLAHAGTIEGSLSVFGGSASLDDGSVVEGNVATFGGTLHRAPNAEVRGDLLGGPSMPAMPSVSSRQKGVLSHVGDLLAWEFSTLAWAVLLALLGMVAVAVAPKGMGRIATTAARELPMSFGLGLLTWVVAVLAGLVLLIACGLGLLVWLALVVSLLVGWLAVGLWIGQRLMQVVKAEHVTSIWEIALGVFVITILSRIPWLCVGGILGMAIGSVGLGAVVLSRFGTQLPEPGGRSQPVSSAGSPDDAPPVAETSAQLPAVSDTRPVANGESEAATQPEGGVEQDRTDQTG